MWCLRVVTIFLCSLQAVRGFIMQMQPPLEATVLAASRKTTVRLAGLLGKQVA